MHGLQQPADPVHRLYPQTHARCRSDSLPDLLAPAVMGVSGAMSAPIAPSPASSPVQPADGRGFAVIGVSSQNLAGPASAGPAALSFGMTK